MFQDTSTTCKSTKNINDKCSHSIKNTTDISFRLNIPGYLQTGFSVMGSLYIVSLSRMGKSAVCPHCHRRSHSLHSHYTRRLQGLEVYGHELSLQVDVRKFRCRNPACKRMIFSEPLDGLASRYARNTLEVERRVHMTSLKTTSRIASELLGQQHIHSSSSSCLRRAAVLPPDLLPSGRPVAIGIDDFAWRKGHTYGSVVVDQVTHLPLAILPSRDGKALEGFLLKNPQLQYVTRDRACCFREAISSILPGVTQICDRFHLIKNMLDVLTEELASLSHMDMRRRKYHYPTEETCRRKIMQTFMELGDERHRKKLKQFVDADNCLRKGMGMWQTAQELGVHPCTIGRIVRHHSARDYMSAEQKNILRYADELVYVISHGCDSLKGLKERMKGKMDAHTVARATLGIRKEMEREKREIREYNRSIGGRKNKKPATKRKIRDFILTGKTSVPELKALLGKTKANEGITLARQFREMINGKPGMKRLDWWITQATNSSSQAMREFAYGINQDREAVQNAIDICLSNGLLEGNVNKIKAVKRQMFNRASPTLLNVKIIAFKTLDLHLK